MTPSQIHAQFVAEFCQPGTLRCATFEQVVAAERELQTSFPAAYLSFVTHCGSGATPALAAMSRETGVWPMTQLLSPTEAVTVSRTAWQAGLPRHLVAVARGEKEDLLCFCRASEGQRRVEEALWSFLCDSGEVMRAFDSFDDCLQQYLDERYDRDE